MDEDAELGIAKPVRSAVAGERVPGGVERDAGIVLRCLYAHFRDLRGDVAGVVRLGRGLCEERGSGAEEPEQAKCFHGDTIAEGAVIC